MSSIIPGTDFQRYTSNSPIASLGELVFHGTIAIPNNFTGEQALPVTFTDSPLHALGRYGRLVRDAFLTLKYITISTQKSPTFSDKHRSPVSQAFSITMAASSVDQVQNFTFNNEGPNFFTRIGFEGYAALATQSINDIKIARHTGADVYDLGYSVPVSTQPPPIELASYFDPIDTLSNLFDSTGFDIQFISTNSAATATSFTMLCYGVVYTYDWIQMLVRYKDWQGNIYNAGVFDDLTRLQSFPLGQQVQASIINPAQLQFGSVIFDPINFNTFFNASYTYDVVLSASIDVFLG